jgi:hypothetical protein
MSEQDLFLHLVPIKIDSDISTSYVMLAQDLRIVEDDVFPRSFLIALDDKGLYCMPAVDEGMRDLGCRCYLKNPFSHSALFRKVQSYTPGFVADCGFALASCQTTTKTCELLMDVAKHIMKIVISSIALLSVPSLTILEVDRGLKQDGLKNMVCYTLCDSKMISQLRSGKEVGALSLENHDVAELMKSNGATTDSFEAGGMRYNPIIPE